MPLSEFGRPKADLNIQINNSTIHPGDELEARVELLPREDFHVRLGKVELVCVETCVQTTRSQYGVHYSKRTHTRTLAGETIMENMIVRRWGGYSTDVRFVVPPDALPSLSGTTVQKIEPGIAWAVTAFLDVTKARDMRQRQEFTVVRPTALEDPPPSPIVAESRHRQCVLTLSLSRSDARSGDSDRRQPARRNAGGGVGLGGQGRACQSREVRQRVARPLCGCGDARTRPDVTVRPNAAVAFSVGHRPGRCAEPEDGEIVGQVVGEGDTGQKDAARPTGGAGDQRRFLTAL